MRLARSVLMMAALAAVAWTMPRLAAACPFCSAPSLTLSEQMAQADAAVLVQWVGGKPGTEDDAGTTTFEIVEVARAPKATLKKGDKVTLVPYRAGKKGNLFLLTGTKGAAAVEWGSPIEVTETSYQYIVQAPSPETAQEKRLAYFGKFLEFPDQLISNDAYAEFANAPYKDIAPLAKTMDHERVRKWILNAETPVTRLGLYGLMLGLCGNAEDAKLMEQKITQETDDFRLGIDGLMGGYLLLTGDKGLDTLDHTKLRNKKVPFSETYAAMSALRFMWDYGDNRISKDRLRQSMRLLLDRPELADLVIADLARWKDWSVQDDLMKLYGADEYNIPSIKRAIVRYMMVSTKDVPEGADHPEHVTRGEKYLAELEAKDPKTVSEAKRFFFVK